MFPSTTWGTTTTAGILMGSQACGVIPQVIEDGNYVRLDDVETVTKVRNIKKVVRLLGSTLIYFRPRVHGAASKCNKMPSKCN